MTVIVLFMPHKISEACVQDPTADVDGDAPAAYVGIDDRIQPGQFHRLFARHSLIFRAVE